MPIIEEIERLAKDDGVSFSQVVMQLIKEHVYQIRKQQQATKEHISILTTDISYDNGNGNGQHYKQQYEQHQQKAERTALDSLDSLLTFIKQSKDIAAISAIRTKITKAVNDRINRIEHQKNEDYWRDKIERSRERGGGA
jgi:hypothetical protein